MIRFLHTADFHFGIDSIGPVDTSTGLNARVLDYIDTFDAMTEFAADEKVDLVIISGDLFHKRNPDITYANLMTRCLLKLANACPIVIIPGNHDMPSENKAGVVDLYDTLQIDNVIVAGTPTVLDFETANGPVQLACMPYPMRSRYLTTSDVHRKNANEIWRAKIQATIKQLLDIIVPGIPTIFMGHFSVSGAAIGSERLMIIGNDAEVQLSDLLDARLDYVALGHLHLFQDIGSKDLPVVYPGSMERVDFTEETHKKGFVYGKLERGNTTYKFVKVDARCYKTIRIDVTGMKRPTKEILSAIEAEADELERAIVRVIIDADFGVSIHRQDIIDLLESLDVFAIHSVVVKSDKPDSETRLGDKPIASYNEMELLDAYFESTNKFNKAEISELLAIAADVMEDVNLEVEYA